MMTMIALRKVGSWLKNYWYIPVILICIVFAFIALQRVPDPLINIIRKSRDIHAKEIKALNDIHSEEIKKREEANNLYFETIDKIEKKFEQDNKKLDAKKKKEIKKVIEKYKNNPNELTNKLSDLTGFSVV